MKRGLILTAAAVLLILPLAAFCQTTPEFRSMEITSWSSGFENPSATTAMVDYIRSCNMNCVIPEVRLRADAYYTSSIEPRGTGVFPAVGYDPLGDIITKAHAVGMEVHPWVVTFRIWTGDSGPSHMSPEHIWWTHGPGNTDPAQDWTMRSDTGAWSYGGVSNLDPGHPAVEDYLISVFMEMVNNYDVDGLNLDYIRYPATNWGYNAVSVQRFNSEYGRSGNPNSGDTTWQDWRRDQVTNLVKRLYLEIKATKPWVKLSADVWNSWSSGNSAYFQDWNKWTQNHWIDFVHPMSYTSNNNTYHTWLNDYTIRQYGRHVYPLADVSIGVPDCVLPQIDMVRSHGFQGLGLYAYNSILNRTDLQANLAAGPFSTFVDTPGMPWLDSPTTGYIKGFVKNAGGTPIYPATVAIISPVATTKNTGTGFYGFVDVSPGTRTVRATAPGYNTVDTPVTVTAGQVTNCNITLTAETIPPVITNVRTSNVQASNAQVLWTTNEAATSQVEYGKTTAYGNTTTEDVLRGTSHTVQLVGLEASTLYHYRVRSYDVVRNMSVSSDYTFTTTARDTVANIVVEENAGSPYFALTGAWSGGTSGYYYTSGSVGGKLATWRPNIIVSGNYDVYARWVASSNRTTIAPFKVAWTGGSETVVVNQQINGGFFNLLRNKVPFSLGYSSAYVELSNAGVESDKNVIADAVMLVYSTDQPPTPPSNVVASALSTNQLYLTWNPSTDPGGTVAGYRVFRGGVQKADITTTYYNDTAVNKNSPYTYYIKAYDNVGNVSDASASVTRYTMSVPPDAATITCDKPANVWQTTSAFKFTAVTGFGPMKVTYYRYAFEADDFHAWTGTEAQWSNGFLNLTAPSPGYYYLHIKGYNGDGVENGQYTYGPFMYDGSAPTVSDLNDGGKYTDAAGQLHASWTGTDADSGIAEYQYAIGTSSGGTNILGWTTTGTTASVTTTDLTLAAKTKYYIAVKARNGAGTWSTIVNSDGVTGAVPVNSILEAKARADGDAIMLTDRVISADLGTVCYICDSETDGRTSGIRVDGASGEGHKRNVSGIIRSVNGEWVIQEPEFGTESSAGTPAPVFMIGKSVGGEALNSTPGITDGSGTNNIGVLISIVGRVENSGTGYFMLNDGSIPIKVSTARLTEIPGNGAFVKVTGIVSTEKAGTVVTPIILSRANTDVPQPWH